jgi:selenocysteine lyase/cysteine desulfurase
VWAHVDGLCDRLVDGLQAIKGAHVLSDRSAQGRSGIVSFALDGVSPDEVAERLNASKFVCGSRSGGVRIAAHGYNTADEIDELVLAAAHEKNR